MKKLKVVILIVFIAQINVAMGQWTIHNFTSSGATIDEPTSIKSTTNGEVWIGTKESGVASYDGATWNSYDINNSGFPNNYIRTLYTSGNTVFVGTGYNGIGKFNGSSWTTTNKTNSSNGLADDEVLGIAYDGNLYQWYATYNGLSVDSITKWRSYTTSNSTGMPTNQIRSISIDVQNNKWLGTDGSGLLKFNNNTWTSYRIDNSSIPSNTITKTAIAPNGNIWVCTSNGVAEFDKINTWTVYNSTNIEVITNNNFNDIAIDNAGNIFLATNDGLVTYGINGVWSRWHSGNSNLPSNYITTVALNTTNNKTWVGTLASGVAEHDISTLLSNHFQLIDESSVIVFPNPINEKLTISLQTNDFIDFLSVKILSLSGSELISQNLENITKGIIEKSILTESLSPGIYLLKINTGKNSIIKKIVKY